MASLLSPQLKRLLSYARPYAFRLALGVMLLAGTRRNRVINNYVGLDRFGRRLPDTSHAVINKGPR